MLQEGLCMGTEEFRIAHKPESADKLVKGAAHDFNNILAVIGGYAELLRFSMDADDKRQRYLLEILAAVARGADLTRSMLAFSAKHEPPRQV